MGRIRSALRRFVKPAAMVGTVGILSFGMVVTTPSNAHALRVYPKIPPTATFVMGATRTVAPVAMAAASFTPPGLLLRLGFLAFSTADLWVPLVTEAFGAATNEPIKPLSPNQYSDPNVHLTGISKESYGTLVLTGTTTAPTTTGNINFHVVAHLKCASNPDGTGTQYTYNVAPSSYYSQTVGRNFTLKSTCTAGYLYGAVAGPRYGDPLLTAGSVNGLGPSELAKYGSLNTGNPGFDPKGDNVGYQGRSECINTQGTVSWAEGPITPGDNDGGTMVMPSCEKAGKGHGTGRNMVKGFKPDGTTETVWDTGTTPLSDPATPLCDPGRAGSGCIMEITKDGQPCTVGDVECENWASEAPKDATGTRWKCKLGPYTLALSACGLLERAYVPGGSPLNDPNTDANPDTRSPLGPDASAPPVSAPAPVIAPAPAAGPGTSGNPGAGADEKTRNCFPAGWAAFNPIEWILKPLRCAFEPTQNAQNVVSALQARAATKAPISFLNMEMTGPGSSGCPAWVVTLPGFSQNVVCESSFTAAILSIRLPLFGILSAAMVWPLLRSLWYAAIPILRVTPSSGGK